MAAQPQHHFVEIQAALRGERRLLEIGRDQDVGTAAGLLDKGEPVAAEKYVKLLGGALAFLFEVEQSLSNITAARAQTLGLHRLRTKDQLPVGVVPLLLI